jgi:hypothetical protein
MAQRDVWMAVAALGMQLLGAGLGSKALAKNCQTDADCGGAPATCELTSYQTCAGKDPACPAGSACGDKPTRDRQAGCAPYVEGICRQPYELPCRVDADCGVGFRCAEQIGRVCWGMGTTGGNGVAPSFHEECYETRGTFACELIEASCSADSDCVAGLHCLPSQASTCGITTASPAVSDCAEVPMVCAPEGYFGASLAGEDRDSAGGTVVEEGSAASEASGGCSLGARSGCEGWLALAGVLFLRRRRQVSGSAPAQ